MCKLSILIPTVYGREADYRLLCEHLLNQAAGLSDADIEVLGMIDDKAMPIGWKRQRLIEAAKGEYVVFIDDDDWVPNHYVFSILKAIEADPDGIGFYQRFTTDGTAVRFACLSNSYEAWAENVDGFHYVRTPNHLNPVKKSIALQVGYESESTFGEDKDYSDRLKKSGLIKNEVLIDDVLYTYRYRTNIPNDEKYGGNTGKPKEGDSWRPMIIGEEKNMRTLKITHNAGFFSCSCIALVDIRNYLMNNCCLPDEIDRSSQYELYKDGSTGDLIPYYFYPERKEAIPQNTDLTTDNRELQFSDYKKIDFLSVLPFVRRYFLRSDFVNTIRQDLLAKYDIDLDNTCAVFYRGNDKNRETQCAPYSEFIEKAREVKAQNPNIKFLVQPDETEFLEAFLAEFPDAIHFSETPHIRKCDSAVFLEMPKSERALFGAKFFAAVLVLSQCKHLITHTGNCSLWAVLYREHANNVHQYLNGEWV